MANALPSRRDDASRADPSCPFDPEPSGNYSAFLTAMIAVVPSLPYPVLTQLATCVIDAIDEAAGDPDREEDDPSGDHVDEFGEVEPLHCPPLTVRHIGQIDGRAL